LLTKKQMHKMMFSKIINLKLFRTYKISNKKY
jgi:hypothetical protein